MGIEDGIGKISIQQDVKDIKEKILGGRLYGVMIIEEDVNSMIAAAYYLGKNEGMEYQRQFHE